MTAVERFYEAIECNLLPVAVPIEGRDHEVIGLAAQGMSYDPDVERLLYSRQPEERAYGLYVAIRETRKTVQRNFDTIVERQQQER